MPANDPQVLTVKQVPGATAEQMDYNFFYRTVDGNGNPLEKPARLCGISFFGELGGHDSAVEKGIELWSSQDTRLPAAYNCRNEPYPLATTKYGMTYETYLNALYHGGLCKSPASPVPGRFNYVRLFLEHQWGRDVHAFDRAPNGKFNLHVVDEKFLNRLAEFVEKARARGIVVCIVLTTIQAIKPEDWVEGPFYFSKNNNFPRTADPLDHSPDGRPVFCDIVRPKEYQRPATPWPGISECFDPPYNPNWTRSEKFYFIQHQLFRRVVEKTRGYWNVVYEICNEASPGVTNIVPWHSTVAGWLNDCLRPDLETPRSRLISVSPLNSLLFNAANPSQALINTLRGQVDFIGLHGGQWTDDPSGSDNRCNATPIPSAEAIATKMKTTIGRFRGKGYALLYDADAAYRAQRLPTPYVAEVLRRDGSFNYRWSEDHLSEVVNPNGDAPPPPKPYCKKVNGNLGLDQRLGLIRAAQGFAAKVTPLPLPAAAVPNNLAAAFAAGSLKLTFGRPARPADPKDPDTKPEGYVVFFGSTPATVGQGAEQFPPRRYLRVANPESPQLNIPVTLTANQRELYLAVAAYNGPLVGPRSNVAHVTIPRQ